MLKFKLKTPGKLISLPQIGYTVRTPIEFEANESDRNQLEFLLKVYGIEFVCEEVKEIRKTVVEEPPPVIVDVPKRQTLKKRTKQKINLTVG